MKLLLPLMIILSTSIQAFECRPIFPKTRITSDHEYFCNENNLLEIVTYAFTIGVINYFVNIAASVLHLEMNIKTVLRAII